MFCAVARGGPGHDLKRPIPPFVDLAGGLRKRALGRPSRGSALALVRLRPTPARKSTKGTDPKTGSVVSLRTPSRASILLGVYSPASLAQLRLEARRGAEPWEGRQFRAIRNQGSRRGGVNSVGRPTLRLFTPNLCASPPPVRLSCRGGRSGSIPSGLGSCPWARPGGAGNKIRALPLDCSLHLPSLLTGGTVGSRIRPQPIFPWGGPPFLALPKAQDSRNFFILRFSAARGASGS